LRIFLLHGKLENLFEKCLINTFSDYGRNQNNKVIRNTQKLKIESK